MAITTTDKAHHTGTSELGALSASWRRRLTAQRISTATLSPYGTSVGLRSLPDRARYADLAGSDHPRAPAAGTSGSPGGSTAGS
jgi:hypothetical protein